MTETAGDARDRGAEVRPTEVSQIAANLPFVLRTLVGMAGLAVGANIVGVIGITLIVGVLNASATRHQLTVVLVTAGVLVIASVLIGVSAGAIVQRRTLRWLLRGDVPSRADAHRALRMPLDFAIISAVLWTVGGAVIGITTGLLGEDMATVLGLTFGSVLAGLGAAGMTYLLIGRVNRPVALLALAAHPPRTAPLFGLRWRMFLSWALTTAVPIVGLVLVLTAPSGKTHIVGTGIVVAVVTIVVSGSATLLFSRAIGDPLRGVVDGMRRVGDGDLDVDIDIEDAGEIGLVQNGLNEMVLGLRERERIQDLFGRHVGSSVAAEAISGGVTMRGESRDVVALFVDITGSTGLTRRTAPDEFFAMLNRFFEVVVDQVEIHGGLLNKFEGDAALCVFGAPAPLDDPYTSALEAARGIRDRVAEMGEVQIGIGVAAGPVIAGQIGAASRLEYTIIGDAVNEAARLTELAKRVDGNILASAEAVEASTPEEQSEWVRGRVLRLRGRESPTRSYRSATAPELSGAPSLGRRLGDVARAVTDFPLPTSPLSRD